MTSLPAPPLRFIPFQRSTEQRYLIVAADKKLTVYRNGEKQAEVAIPHVAAQLPELTWTRSPTRCCPLPSGRSNAQNHVDGIAHVVVKEKRAANVRKHSDARFRLRRRTRLVGDARLAGMRHVSSRSFVVAGSRLLPQTVWGSKSAIFGISSKKRERAARFLTIKDST